MSSGGSSLGATFLGALQGSVAVLLTLLAGYVSARGGYLDHPTVKHVSKLCTVLFLPSLIIVGMGPELTASKLSDLWIIPLWGFVSTLIAHAFGWLGQRMLRLPHWVIIAAGRPNSNALPLLLIQSLEHTGVLDALARPGEDASATLSRAKPLILLNAIVQQIFTFQLAPGVIALDDGHRKDSNPENANRLRPGPGTLTSVVQDPERVGLLHDHGSDDQPGGSRREHYTDALNLIKDAPNVHWPFCLSALEKPLKTLWSYISAPLIGGIIAFVIGMTPPLHKAILDEDGVLYSSITQSIKNLGDLFVVLQSFTVGAELALVPSTHPGTLAMSYVLAVRFLLMPVLSLLFVWVSAGRGLYVDDRLAWFLLVLIPSGPSALLLVSVAELVDVDQGPIAGYLTIAVRILSIPSAESICVDDGLVHDLPSDGCGMLSRSSGRRERGGSGARFIMS
ncbi:putative transporter C5D6.04 [Grifola frondosa]|uniref:Putative transporter C5D6.04 n=1 Tax=Grifola frondosa TaxID=5627 RepID=A0A1C7LU29_GRIFR|nr:putative transporter C5D6.04 [Grifola frondosa]